MGVTISVSTHQKICYEFMQNSKLSSIEIEVCTTERGMKERRKWMNWGGGGKIN